MNLGIREKLIVSIVAFMFLLAAFLVLYYPWRYQNDAESALRTRAETAAIALGSALAEDMGLDRAHVQSSLDMFAQRSRDGQLLYLQVSLADGTQWADWKSPDFELGDETEMSAVQRADVAERQVYIRDHGDHLHLGTAILDEVPGQGLQFKGSLHVVMANDAVAAATMAARIEAAIIGLVLVIIGIVVGLIVGKSFTAPLLDVADHLEQVSKNLAEAARDQEMSSSEEAAAVAETRRSMTTLLDSAQKIADRSTNVLGNAERTTNGNQEIARRISNLNLLSERVADILGAIMQIADRADLLALNASLEGTRAGDAGKGFALVGAEMRRLAENVIESVGGIRELMNEMRDVSQATVLASEEGTRSSNATRQSAEEIVTLTEEQREATRQVISSMEALGGILELTLQGIQRTSASADEITQLAADLHTAVKPAPREQITMSTILEDKNV